MKSMKKLVLAGFVLLASVVVLTGCDTQLEPEPEQTTVNEHVQEKPNTEQSGRNRDTVDSVTFSSSDTKFYYGEMVTVTLATATEGATIHYQLGEGKWEIYEEPFTVSSEIVVTAYATKDGLKDSEKTNSNYLRQLISITVTPPTRTVYSVDEPFVSTGMVVTANYDDGKERPVEGTITSEASSLTKSAGINKGVTVSYTEGGVETTDIFTVDVVDPSVPTILTSYISPNHIDDTWIYVAFGEWPQTIKDISVEVIEDESTKKEMGMFTAYLGGDGNYYVKAAEKAYGSEDEYKYSDGTQAGQGGESEKWFKVEPIVWRVLNKDDSTGKALLLAEKILTGGIPYYVDNSNRTIGSTTVYPNNYKYSTIRAWLNGSYETDDTQEKNYEGKGFLQTAFTTSAQKLIAETTVDNSKESTFGRGETGGDNPYVCTNTSDKIFLLSKQEATTAGYGFVEYNKFGEGNTRIRVTTDYAKATGVGGWWCLRSPYGYRKNLVHLIRYDGYASDCDSVYLYIWGVVPALSISLQ